MSGIPDFNFPLFFKTERFYRKHYRAIVFNPARKDVERYGHKFKSLTGKPSKWFSLREALAADTKWLCEKADTIVMLPKWENSKGARAEHALAVALGLKIIYQ